MKMILSIKEIRAQIASSFLDHVDVTVIYMNKSDKYCGLLNHDCEIGTW
jgi:hypothetical protein